MDNNGDNEDKINNYNDCSMNDKEAMPEEALNEVEAIKALENNHNDADFDITIDCNDEISDDSTSSNIVKSLHISWEAYDRYNIISDLDSPPEEFEVVWQLKHIESLDFCWFPYYSMIQIPGESSANDEDSTTTTTTTTTSSSSTTTSMVPPVSIGNLSKTLKTFGLYYHSPVILPPDIGMLVNLTKLTLQHGTMESVPSEIGNLSNLEKLEICFMDRLQYLPSEIGNLDNLKHLSICKNKLLVELPIEFNNLSTHLQVMEIYMNRNLKQSNNNNDNDDDSTNTSCFDFDIRHFTELRELDIGWDEICWILLQHSPSSLETLTLRGFEGYQDLSKLQQRAAAASSSAASHLSTLFPKGIRKLTIDFSIDFKHMTKTNKNIIHTLLQSYNKLGNITTTSDYNRRKPLDLQDESSLFWFTKESLFLMFFNRCGGILVGNPITVADKSKSSTLSSSSEKEDEDAEKITTTIQKITRPLPLSMWAIVLGKVKERIGKTKTKNKETEKTIMASVIFSLLQVPALMEHLTVNCFSNNNFFDNGGSVSDGGAINNASYIANKRQRLI